MGARSQYQEANTDNELIEDFNELIEDFNELIEDFMV